MGQSVVVTILIKLACFILTDIPIQCLVVLQNLHGGTCTSSVQVVSYCALSCKQRHSISPLVNWEHTENWHIVDEVTVVSNCCEGYCEKERGKFGKFLLPYLKNNTYFS
jgi:hypothetical protein